MFSARAHSVEITPNKPLPLAGFAKRKGNFHSVHDALEANVLLLQAGEKQIAVLSLDVLFVGPALTKEITELAQCVLHIEPQNLLIAASHTHFAPGTDDTKPNLGEVNQSFLKAVVQSVGRLFNEVANKEQTAVRVETKQVMMRHAVNRRRSGWHIDPSSLRLKKGVYMAPNFAETTEDIATVLRLVDERSNLYAVLWSYACHPTGFVDTLSVSSEFPGRVRQNLREKSLERLPVVFLQGFAGDKRPIELGGKVGVLGRLRRSVGGPHFGRFNAASYEEWVSSLSREIVDCLESCKEWKNVSPSIKTARVDIENRAIIDYQSVVSPEPLSIQCMKVGAELMIVALGAEPVTHYLRAIVDRTGLDGYAFMPVGYINSVFGYLPTENMVADGGYEGGEFFSAFGLEGGFQAGFEEKVLNGIQNCIQSIV